VSVRSAGADSAAIQGLHETTQALEEMMGTITRNLLASVLFLLIMLGWLGDSLLSVLIGRPRLSFQEVYGSWKNQLLRQRLSAAEKSETYWLS
jgi:hypothetical protein